jgi:uroporphyrinogen decarboxylase
MMDFGFWRETLDIWQAEGLPPNIVADDFFGMDPQWIWIGAHMDLCPYFEETVLEDRGETEVARQKDGVIVERGKFLYSIPRHLEHPLKDRKTWREIYKPRLEPETPERFPDIETWEANVREWKRPDRDYPLYIQVGSLYGKARNWFGLERISEILYDDRPLFEEVVETLADISVAVIHKALSTGVRPEAAIFWEDMCYNRGPLISPKVFREVLVPQYQRITAALGSYGVDVVMVDCDGDIQSLVPYWLEAGVNMMYPIEVGTWGGDPVAYREKYGRNLLIMGGVDKNILTRGPEAIDREIDRLTPLVEEGGYIPTPDHKVPPSVPLANYWYYLDRIREVWGKGLENLRPRGELLQGARSLSTTPSPGD